jgi:hypothetical protein
MDKLLATHLSEFNQIFSYIICAEDMVEVGEFKVKELSPLLKSRDQ